MSKSAPAELRLSSIFGLASARAELANWPEPTRKWGQLIKLFMTRLCCKHQTHTHTHTEPEPDDGQCWCASFVVSRLSLCFALSLLRLPFLFCCPFAPLSLCPLLFSALLPVSVSRRIYFCNATRNGSERLPGQEQATQSSKHVVCMCYTCGYSRNWLC